MFSSLRERTKSLLNPGRKDPLSRVFQDPDYVQDGEERAAQLAFFKLLMMIAHSDEGVDNAELNLLKDYVYEHCLNENEWRELSYYAQHKAEQNEIQAAIEAMIGEIRGKIEKQEFLQAVQSMIDADSVTGAEERQILEHVRARIEAHDVSLLGNLVRGIKNRLLTAELEYSGHSDARDFSLNPLVPLLKQALGKADARTEVIAAKLGIAILVIHCDRHFDEKELPAFAELARNETGLSGAQADDLIARILKVPDNHFELTRLGRILTESQSEDERRNFLESMFRIARADGVFEIIEENYLRVIAAALMLPHRLFIQAKLASE